MADDPLLIVRIASLPFARLEALHAGEAVATLHEACAWAERVEAAAAALESSLFAAAGPPEAGPRLGPDESAVAALPARLLLLPARRAVHGRRPPPLAPPARELRALH